MDSLTTIFQVVGAIANVSALAAEALMQRLLAILLTMLLVGGTGGFVVGAFAWLWIKRTIGEPRLSRAFDAAGSGAGIRHSVAR